VFHNQRVFFMKSELSPYALLMDRRLKIDGTGGADRKDLAPMTQLPGIIGS